ncbi:hypothetical protein XACM_3010 [Xanthomonas euvesicatoria pv. citrumelo F1]|nr:hypothetical protein XACM_3010 [Xanthomonas euvesicatoria pv. citrumelo F1]
MDVAGGKRRTMRCAATLGSGLDQRTSQPGPSPSSPSIRASRQLRRSERLPVVRRLGVRSGGTAAAQAWPAKKFSDRLTPFAALARFTDRGAVHGDLGLSGCPSIPPRHAKDSHVTSQPDCARLVAGRLLARTHCTAARTITQRVRTTTRDSAATAAS